jgi:hypothetical protein
MVQIHMLVVQCQFSTSSEFAYGSSKQDTKALASLSLPNRCQGFIGEIIEAFEHQTGRDIYPLRRAWRAET